MNLGKITQKLGELASCASNIPKKASLFVAPESQISEISSSTSKAMRSYGLSSVIFSKADTPKGNLKNGIKKYISFLEEYAKNNRFSANGENPKPRVIAKKILKVANDKNIHLLNVFLEEPDVLFFNKLNIFALLDNIEDEKTAKELSIFFKKCFANQGISKNNRLLSIILSHLQYTKTIDSKYTQSTLKMINSWLEDSKISGEFRLNGVFRELYGIATFSPEKVDEILDFIKITVGKNGYFEGDLDFLNSAESIFDLSNLKNLEIKKKFIEKLATSGKEYKGKMSNALRVLCEENADIIEECTFNPLLSDNKSIATNSFYIFSNSAQKKPTEFIRTILNEFLNSPEMANEKSIHQYIGLILKNADNPDKRKLVLEILEHCKKQPQLYGANIGSVLACVDKKNSEFAFEYLLKPEFHENLSIKSHIGSILSNASKNHNLKQHINEILKNYQSRDELKEINIGAILANINESNNVFIEQFLNDPFLYQNPVLNSKISNFLSSEYVRFFELEDFKKTLRLLKPEALEKLFENPTELLAVSKIIDLHNIDNLNQISITQKRKLLRNIVSQNTTLFDVGKLIKKEEFPLLPVSQEDYCRLLPALVKSIGIQTKELSAEEIAKFNSSIFDLSRKLAQISDEDFAKLKITQSYPKEDFIQDILLKIESLDEKERQKIFDYFGFELTLSGDKYTIIGYPVNLNNGQKLSEISDETTKRVIEEIREQVVRFSEKNQIRANNPDIQKLLNDILTFLPEFRPMFGKMQHETHDYDIALHSLKLMAKIAQNPDFEKLSVSDKKVTLIASLLHDITKAEGLVSPMHASESAFDAFFIAKKFNLSQEEEIKLNTLIKHHEWLAYANTASTPTEEIARLQSVAYDFQAENIFEIAKIFTLADLKAVKKTDKFYDYFKADFERLSKKIDDFILQLQKTQPILPTTKLPSADVIGRGITKVNQDMSTNIKGLYKTPEGLIVIKFNEVEDWKELGFPAGTVSRGIKAISEADGKVINTGNIKFIVHGLDRPEQLITFDTFTMPDSNALLSASYSERPESKYRFFRTQGVIVDTDTTYIHGGGHTDTGSGCKKTIDTFKTKYIFGGSRESDRTFISNLIKRTLELDEQGYIEFVKKYKNKSMLEIEPKEVREKLIKAMAQINSNTRIGNREYNEIYISNPKIMGVFAYSPDDKVGKISDFIAQQENFLKKYALEHNMPFIVFGD